MQCTSQNLQLQDKLQETEASKHQRPNSMRIHEHTHTTIQKKSGKMPCDPRLWMCNSEHTSKQLQTEKETSCPPGKKQQFIYPARFIYFKKYNLL